MGEGYASIPTLPRYTSSWEYLVRMLGLTLDETNLYLTPFRSLHFELRGVVLAGVRLSVRVEPGWSRVIVNGMEQRGSPVLKRDARAHRVEFLGT
jgi:hypothetical protein